MVEGKGQVATEYLVITVFVLAVVTVIFAFAYVNYDQSVKIARAGDALTTMIGAADEVYLLGEGNTRFVDVSFPSGMTSIVVKEACCNDADCTGMTIVADESDCTYDVKFSLIEITVNLIGGSTEIARESKAKLLLYTLDEEGFDAWEMAGGTPFTIKVSWIGGEKIKLQRV